MTELNKYEYTILTKDAPDGYTLSVKCDSFDFIKNGDGSPICYRFFEDPKHTKLIAILNFENIIGVLKRYKGQQKYTNKYKVQFTDNIIKPITVKADKYIFVCKYSTNNKDKDVLYFEFFEGSKGSYKTMGIINFGYVSFLGLPNKLNRWNKV